MKRTHSGDIHPNQENTPSLDDVNAERASKRAKTEGEQAAPTPAMQQQEANATDMDDWMRALGADEAMFADMDPALSTMMHTEPLLADIDPDFSPLEIVEENRPVESPAIEQEETSHRPILHKNERGEVLEAAIFPMNARELHILLRDISRYSDLENLQICFQRGSTALSEEGNELIEDFISQNKSLEKFELKGTSACHYEDLLADEIDLISPDLIKELFRHPKIAEVKLSCCQMAQFKGEDLVDLKNAV